MSEIKREIIKNENGLMLIKSISSKKTVYFIDQKVHNQGFNRLYAGESFIKTLNLYYEIKNKKYEQALKDVV